MAQPSAGQNALPVSSGLAAAAPEGVPAPADSTGVAAAPAAAAAAIVPAAMPVDDADPTGNMNQVLETNFLGVHKLKVKQIQNTEYTRQLSRVGVKLVKESIEARGWIAANAPYVLVPREQLPDGKETVWSGDVLSSLQAFCLDGNHRLRALETLYGADFELDVRLYLHFDDDIMVNALARSELSPCLYVPLLLWRHERHNIYSGVYRVIHTWCFPMEAGCSSWTLELQTYPSSRFLIHSNLVILRTLPS